MRILVFGGFLGSGKTTIINRLIHAFDARGEKAAVIENEIGDIGIDDTLVSGTGVTVTPLFGGCVCCEISGNLLAAVKQIEQEVAPDWLVVEMTGLALMTSIKDVFEKYGGGAVVKAVSVVDMARFDTIHRALRPVLNRQVRGADVVVINKTDVHPATEEAINILDEISSGAPCLEVSATRLEGEELLTKLERALSEGGRHHA
jgi:G3E family GTPase